MKWMTLAAMVGGLAWMPACTQPVKQTGSTLKWGSLEEAPEGFLSLAPNSTITTCGYKAEQEAANVKTWADTIGRGSHLNINSNCTSGADRKITVFGPEDAAGTDTCGSSSRVAGFTDGRDIYVCQEFQSKVEFHVMLHETGHLWGLCDQYGDASNCDPESSGRQDPNSVMGAARGLTALTADDIEGIRTMAQRDDIPNKAQWDRLLAGGNPGGNTGGSNTGGNTGGNSGSGRNPPPPPVSGGRCSCEIDASGQFCAVFQGNEAFAWVNADSSDRSCRQACGAGGILADSLAECSGSSSNPGSSDRGGGLGTSGNTGSRNPGTGSSSQSLCASAGGRWTADDGSGFGLCDCGALLWREDAMQITSASDFTSSCRSQLGQ